MSEYNISSENSLNPAKGRSFQNTAREILSEYFKTELRCDHAIPIGNPPKIHQFDLASLDLKFVGECKNYSWTRTGNIPSAKMAFLNEALLYLSHLPPQTTRFIAMRRDSHAKRTESKGGPHSLDHCAQKVRRIFAVRCPLCFCLLVVHSAL
jgi:hypothetical protein